MTNIAFICRDNKGVTVNPVTGFTELGDWAITSDRAATVNMITLHESQKSKSYAAYSVIAHKNVKGGRVVFIARPQNYTLNGVNLNWAQEKAFW